MPSLRSCVIACPLRGRRLAEVSAVRSTFRRSAATPRRPAVAAGNDCEETAPAVARCWFAVVLELLARSLGPLAFVSLFRFGVLGPAGRGDGRRGSGCVVELQGPADARDARDGRSVGHGPALSAGRRVLGRPGDLGGLLLVRRRVRRVRVLVLVVEGLQREPPVRHLAATAALRDVRVVLAHRLVPQHLQLGVHAPKPSPYVFRIHVCQVYVCNVHLSVGKNGFVEFQILWMRIRNFIR